MSKSVQLQIVNQQHHTQLSAIINAHHWAERLYQRLHWSQHAPSTNVRFQVWGRAERRFLKACGLHVAFFMFDSPELPPRQLSSCKHAALEVRALRLLLVQHFAPEYVKYD